MASARKALPLWEIQALAAAVGGAPPCGGEDTYIADGVGL